MISIKFAVLFYVIFFFITFLKNTLGTFSGTVKFINAKSLFLVDQILYEEEADDQSRNELAKCLLCICNDRAYRSQDSVLEKLNQKTIQMLDPIFGLSANKRSKTHTMKCIIKEEYSIRAALALYLNDFIYSTRKFSTNISDQKTPLDDSNLVLQAFKEMKAEKFLKTKAQMIYEMFVKYRMKRTLKIRFFRDNSLYLTLDFDVCSSVKEVVNRFLEIYRKKNEGKNGVTLYLSAGNAKRNLICLDTDNCLIDLGITPPGCNIYIENPGSVRLSKSC